MAFEFARVPANNPSYYYPPPHRGVRCEEEISYLDIPPPPWNGIGTDEDPSTSTAPVRIACVPENRLSR